MPVDLDEKQEMKPEELYTILIIGFYLLLYIVPTAILMVLGSGAREYLAALTVFILAGMIFWNAGAVLRD